MLGKKSLLCQDNYSGKKIQNLNLLGNLAMTEWTTTLLQNYHHNIKNIKTPNKQKWIYQADRPYMAIIWKAIIVQY